MKHIVILAGSAVGKTRAIIACAVDYLISDECHVIYISDDATISSITDRFEKWVVPDTLEKVEFWDTVSSIDVNNYTNKKYIICNDCINQPQFFKGINSEDWEKLVEGAVKIISTKQISRNEYTHVEN